MTITEEKRLFLSEEEQEQFKNDEENQSIKTKKGGFITIPFIIANEALERAASYGLTGNMIVYLMKDYNMSVTGAQNLINFGDTANNFTPLAGALLADTLLGRFLTIAFGSIFSFLGVLVLWLTTVIPQLQPPTCNSLEQNCHESPTTGQYAFLLFSFILMSIGAGGIRSCSQIFGVDQIDQGGDSPKHSNLLEILLTWYYTFSCLSIIIALTVFVYIQDNLGWKIGFGIPVVCMFFAAVAFFLATPFYKNVKCDKNLLMSLSQVFTAAFNNRNIHLSSFRHPDANVNYYRGKTSTLSIPTDRLRFFNKACIIRNLEQDIGLDGLPRNPWRLCRVEDVEGVKSFIRLLPIWSAGIIVPINTNIGSLSLLLTRTMNRHLGPTFEIPAASFSTLLIFVIVIWLPLYDQVILPLASKIYGKNVRLSVKQRMLIGLVCYFFGMFSSAILESVRRNRAISEGFEDNPEAVIHMSAAWCVIPAVFNGLGQAFFTIGLTELYYTELPKNLVTIAVSIFGLSSVFGTLISTLILNMTQSITTRGGKDGWIASNVNKGHYDYYYYLLATLNLLNVFYFIYCSRAYGPVGEHTMNVVTKDNVDDQVVEQRRI